MLAQKCIYIYIPIESILLTCYLTYRKFFPCIDAKPLLSQRKNSQAKLYWKKASSSVEKD